MSILRTLLGVEHGIRSTLKGMLSGDGGGAPDWLPDSAYSAPELRHTGCPGRRRATGPPRGVTPPRGLRGGAPHVDAAEAGEVSEVIAGGTAICVANVEGSYHAVSNTCPHADGPLGEGALQGTKVLCPYHGWAFDVTTGVCETNASSSIDVFESSDRRRRSLRSALVLDMSEHERRIAELEDALKKRRLGRGTPRKSVRDPVLGVADSSGCVVFVVMLPSPCGVAASRAVDRNPRLWRLL